MKRTCKTCGTKCLQLSAVCHKYTPDPAARALYLSSCMEEGTLYKVDLDTLQVTASAPRVASP